MNRMPPATICAIAIAEVAGQKRFLHPRSFGWRRAGSIRRRIAHRVERNRQPTKFQLRDRHFDRGANVAFRFFRVGLRSTSEGALYGDVIS